MNLNSFRLKIALLSGLITGLLLVGTGVVVWRISYQFNLDRLDREIRNLGQGNLDREHGPAHYQRFEEALTFISGEGQPKSFLILVRDQEEDVQFLSQNWPTNLNADSFPALTGPVLPEGGAKETASRPAPVWPPLVKGPPPERPDPPEPRRGQPPPGRNHRRCPRRRPALKPGRWLGSRGASASWATPTTPSCSA